MDIQALTQFFMWCSIINTSLFIFWILVFLLLPEQIYRLQNYFFPLSRENFNIIMYAFMGLFKIFLLIFNIVPYVVLLIIA